jgi:hypothetical protein
MELKMAAAFGVRRLGAALAVVSKFHKLPRRETRWAHYRIIAAVSEWNTKAAPSRRTPKAPPFRLLPRFADLTSNAGRRFA